MKIESINIQNILGIRAVDIALTAPVAIIAGRNKAGKSSLIESIRLAMIGKADRVNLKKDYDQLVTDGAKKGTATVSIDVGGITSNCSMTLPSGMGQHSNHEYLPYVLDASLFNSLAVNDRRKMLFKLTACSITAEVILEKLKGRKCSSIKAAELNFKDGIEAASKAAKTKATEAKGSWKAITGETYGEVKAISWKAPEVEATDLPDLNAVETKTTEWADHVARVNQNLGGFQQELKQLAETNARITTLHTKANSIERIKTKIEEDKKQQAHWAAKIADAETKAQGTVQTNTFECPCCGGGLLLENGKLHAHLIEDDVATPDPEAVKALPEYRKAHQLHTSALLNAEKELIQAQVAEEELKTLGAVKTSDSIQTQIDDARTKLTYSQSQHKEWSDKKALVTDHQRKAEAATKATENALKYHTDVAEWTAIGDALAPDGIPAEILASALKPVNDRLRESATKTGWMQVSISSDMQISADGRAYALLCESEKWRTEAMLCEAISHLSGLKLIILDRMDVLDLPSRGELLKWLNSLATSSEIETAIVCGTLKEAYKAPNANFQSFWLEQGVIAALAAA